METGVKADHPITHHVTELKLIEWARKNASGYLSTIHKNPKAIIWRGLYAKEANFLIGNGGSFVRKAANTFNFVNLFVSSDTQWADYPKRESSYICTTDFGNTHNFGNPYLVIPADSTKIGICPTEDFWYAFDFESISNNFQGLGIDTICSILNFIAEQLKIKLSESSAKELRSQLRSIDLDKMSVLADMHVNELDQHYMNFTADIYGYMIKNHINNLEEFLSRFLDPKKNKFEVTTGAKWSALPKEREVWIGDGAVGFVSIEDFNSGEDIDLNKWVKDAL